MKDFEDVVDYEKIHKDARMYFEEGFCDTYKQAVKVAVQEQYAAWRGNMNVVSSLR